MVQNKKGDAQVIDWLITDDDVIPSESELIMSKRWHDSEDYKRFRSDLLSEIPTLFGNRDAA